MQNTLVAIFLIFFCFGCYCDRDQLADATLQGLVNQLKGGNFNTNEFVGSIANDLTRKNNSLQDKDFDIGEFLGSKQSKIRNNSLRFNQVVNQVRQPIKFLKREEVFPKEEVKKVEISPDGQRIVCLVRQGKNQYIKNITNANSSVVQIVKEKYPINNFVLFGKNIFYTYYDGNNVLKVKAQYSLTTTRLLNLPSNLKSVRFFKNNSLCMAECYDGEEYTLYSIRYDKKTNKFLCKREKRLLRPTQSLFNSKLNPVLTIKNENGLTNVYANLGKPVKRSDDAIGLSSDDFVEREEDELPNSEDLEESEDAEDFDNLMMVGQIQNPDSEKYFSVDNNNNWYTATLKKAGNILVINRKKISQGAELNISTSEIFSLKNVSSFSRVKINLDQNGVPSFVSISDKKYKHFSWDGGIKTHLNVINNKFNYASWYRVNTSSDGKIWLICVMSDRLESQFFTYNTINRNFTFIPINSNNNRAYTVNNYNINKLNLRSMSSHYLSKGYVHVFFVRGVKSTINSPLIVMTNSSEQYDWKYMPTVQILANRGFNVLCLNYRKSEEDFTKALQEVINSDIGQKNESQEDEGDDEENDGEKVKREELSSDELKESERIINASVTKAVADIKEAINWALKNRMVKYGNIILFAENHSIIPAMRLFLKNQASFAGFIAIDPSEDDISLVSTFDYGENLKPTTILGNFENSESINAFLGKVPDTDEFNVSVISFKNLIDQKLATGVVETFLHKIFSDKKIESISQKDINSLSFIKGEVDVSEYSDDSNDSVISNWR